MRNEKEENLNLVFYANEAVKAIQGFVKESYLIFDGDQLIIYIKQNRSLNEKAFERIFEVEKRLQKVVAKRMPFCKAPRFEIEKYGLIFFD